MLLCPQSLTEDVFIVDFLTLNPTDIFSCTLKCISKTFSFQDTGKSFQFVTLFPDLYVMIKNTLKIVLILRDGREHKN